MVTIYLFLQHSFKYNKKVIQQIHWKPKDLPCLTNYKEGKLSFVYEVLDFKTKSWSDLHQYNENEYFIDTLK